METMFNSVLNRCLCLILYQIWFGVEIISIDSDQTFVIEYSRIQFVWSVLVEYEEDDDDE